MVRCLIDLNCMTRLCWVLLVWDVVVEILLRLGVLGLPSLQQATIVRLACTTCTVIEDRFEVVLLPSG